MDGVNTTDQALETMAKEAAAALASVKGNGIKLLDLSRVSSFADYFLIASGGSQVHMRALAKKVQKELEGKGARLLHAEGMDGGTWILMDFDTIIVHIFTEQAREFYGLEHLWGDARPVSLEGIVTEETGSGFSPDGKEQSLWH